MNRFRWSLIIGVGILCVMSALTSLHRAVAHVPAAVQLETLPVIIIDPGHAGSRITTHIFY